MARFSTNALTARYCAMNGWPCSTVQSFSGGRRHDLFGMADSIVLHPSGCIWVQNCKRGTLVEHQRKIKANNLFAKAANVGVRLQLWEWKRNGTKFFLRQQWHDAVCFWSNATPWMGPFDLYPKKKK